MQLKFIYPRWGSADTAWPVFLEKVKNAGYDGVEIDLPLDKSTKNFILSLLNDFELKFVGQHWETKELNFNRHKEKFKKHLYNLAESEPILINSHTGMDFFSFAQNAVLIEMAETIEDETGVSIAHETHRSRFSFAAHVCHDYLKKLPFLKLTADFSHWCCVAESLLENQQDAVLKAIHHTFHIHARVGSAQSPQVIDPEDFNYRSELLQFKKWWTLMIKNALEADRSVMTITPEYGPFPYSQHFPNTKSPIKSQWDANQFIKKEIQKDWDLLKNSNNAKT